MKDCLDLLLLEDQEDDAALILRTLERGGLRVELRRVQTREEFLQAISESTWDVILSDFNLPRFNGGEALGLLRERKDETPFILVTGEIGEERAADLMRRGANDFVKKDRLERLVPAIERELREARVRKEHHEAMARLLQLGQAVDQSGDEIVMADPTGCITYVNAAFTASTGYSTEEALGRHPLELLGSGMNAPLHQELKTSVRDTGQWQGRFPGRTKAGAIIILESRIAALRDGQGKLLGFIGTHRDITRQVELEQRMEQSHRMEAIGNLAGGIAHDFNNMLMAIRGFAEIAQVQANDTRLSASLDGILRATDRARDLVQQIMAFSRCKSQERRSIEVRGVLGEALRFIRATIPASITIKQEIGSEASVLADATELQRIIVNLCTNGMQAMRGGSGVLSVSLDEQEIGSGSQCSRPDLSPGRYVRIRVSDSGCGMSPEVAARIFEPFFTTRASTGGTGMGLAVVHGLVASMNGLVSVQSSPGMGSTFEILLPVHHATHSGPGGEQARREHGSGRILFIDDERILCELAEEMLEDLGYTPITFTNPLEAIRWFEADPLGVDLVMTDMTMPGMTGDLVAQSLLAVRPDLPLILCTGYSERIEHDSFQMVRVTRLVQKPFDWSAMSQTIRECLQGAIRPQAE
ncbi:MAG: response regulator [Holophagaceae bacterium]|nr:response regulator [Holophagaceae bacterium]